MRYVYLILTILVCGCEAQLDSVCPNADFYVANVTQEERRVLWETNLRSENFCLNESPRGTLGNCPFPHDFLQARPEKMPPVGSGALLPDIVVEFDSKGIVQNIWTTPADPKVYGIEGLNIFVRQDMFNEDAWQYYKIHSDRSYITVRRPVSLFRKETACPSDLSMFIKPSQVECWAYRDLADSTIRYLALRKNSQCWRTGPNVNTKYFNKDA